MDILQLNRHQDDTRPFAQANADSQNMGMLDDNGHRLPPSYVAHVDDHLYVDVEKHFPTTISASIVALTDAFGGSHECQENILSDERLKLQYSEQRIVLGYQPNSRTMMVEISPRQREKIISYIEFHGWATTKQAGTIKEIAQILGLLQNA